MTLKTLTQKTRQRPQCPRVTAGHMCHKDSKAYGYTCNECGRTGLKT